MIISARAKSSLLRDLRLASSATIISIYDVPPPALRLDIGGANPATAAPTVAGATVLIDNKDGVVFGLEAHTGEVLWEFKTAGRIGGSPIVVGDTMYVVSFDGMLYAVIGAI
jgi:outer membrane protein assembly factor BamB